MQTFERQTQTYNITQTSGVASGAFYKGKTFFRLSGKVHTSVGDYQDVEILPDSVIYCDIPYRNTNVYDKDNPFDYERFYEWCLRQTEPVFISEYWMPDEFECVAEIKHNSTMCATSNNRVVEKVFVPKGQEIKGNIQLTLF